MSERALIQPEDPLPLPREYSHRYNNEPPSTLGEVVVTDPRDPFVWLASEISNTSEMPSTNGKQLLWLIYRMNGNFPDDKGKLRDQEVIDDQAMTLSEQDIRCSLAYQKYLIRIDAENASS